VHAHVTAAADGETVSAALRVGSSTTVHVLSTNATRGETYDTTWTIDAGGNAPPAEVTLPVPIGAFVVEAGTGRDAHAALSGPRDQLVYDYRATSDIRSRGGITRLEVLTPADSLRVRRVGHGLRPRRTTHLRELAVEVSPTR